MEPSSEKPISHLKSYNFRKGKMAKYFQKVLHDIVRHNTVNSCPDLLKLIFEATDYEMTEDQLDKLLYADRHSMKTPPECVKIKRRGEPYMLVSRAEYYKGGKGKQKKAGTEEPEVMEKPDDLLVEIFFGMLEWVPQEFIPMAINRLQRRQN